MAARVVIIIIGTILLLSCATTPKSNLRDKIIGTWSGVGEDNEYLLYYETTYSPNGKKCSIYVEFDAYKSTSTYVVGYWKLEEDLLIQWATKTTDPYIKVGEIIKDKIISVNESTLTLQDLTFSSFEIYERYNMKDTSGIKRKNHIVIII